MNFQIVEWSEKPNSGAKKLIQFHFFSTGGAVDYQMWPLGEGREFGEPIFKS